MSSKLKKDSLNLKVCFRKQKQEFGIESASQKKGTRIPKSMLQVRSQNIRRNFFGYGKGSATV